MRNRHAIATGSRHAEAAKRRTGSPVRHGVAPSWLPPSGRDRSSWRGAHAVQQEVDMKRDDMGRDVLSPSRPTRNPRLEKIFTTRRNFPESRFSQAGKAPKDDLGWIRCSSNTRPHQQCPLWAPIRAGIAAPEIRDLPARLRSLFGAIRPGRRPNERLDIWGPPKATWQRNRSPTVRAAAARSGLRGGRAE